MKPSDHPVAVFTDGPRILMLADTGRLTGVTESVLGGAPWDKQYSYDAAGRLTDVWQGGALVEHYAYDTHGNRTTTEYAGQPAITATFDNQDRLVTYGGVSFTHAITGERLTRTAAGQTTTYGYDTFGQLQTVALPDGTLVEYDYDSAGRRVAKKVDGVYEQRFLFGDAFGPVALVDAAGAVLDRYVYGTSPYVPDYLVRTSGPDAGTYRLLKDERASVRMVVDTATGAVAQQLTYDAFGRVLTDTAPGFTPFGYAGGLLDLDTGLVRFGARDYDPETGRWTTQDPIGLGGGDTNLYAYVANDPVNGIDPSGLAIAGNPAMDSALGGGFLAALGFDTFAQGMANYQLGMLELSNEATFNQGLRDISQGICQMMHGGIGLGTSTGPMAVASAGMVGAAIRALPKVASKAINLPSWKRIAIDMPHVLPRHMSGGKMTQGRTVFPPHMGPRSIESAIREAYRSGSRVGGQGDRVLVQGNSHGLSIEMWVNTVTNMIETAYPVF